MKLTRGFLLSQRFRRDDGMRGEGHQEGHDRSDERKEDEGERHHPAAEGEPTTTHFAFSRDFEGLACRCRTSRH